MLLYGRSFASWPRGLAVGQVDAELAGAGAERALGGAMRAHAARVASRIIAISYGVL